MEARKQCLQKNNCMVEGKNTCHKEMFINLMEDIFFLVDLQAKEIVIE